MTEQMVYFFGAGKAEGDAFGSQPAKGKFKGQQDVSGYLGKGLVNTFIEGDRPQGTLTSPPFRISQDYLAFLIGGGKHPGKTGIELIVDGKSVRTATGRDEERLRWKSWKVREFAGKEGRLRIFGTKLLNARWWFRSPTGNKQNQQAKPDDQRRQDDRNV